MNIDGIVLYIAVNKQTHLTHHCYGIHGYTYTNNIGIKTTSSMPSSHKVTSDGYILTTTVKKQDIAIVNPCNYFDIATTSNVSGNSEILSLISALHYIEEVIDTNLNIKIHIDSPYIKRAIDEWLPVWLTSDWKLSDNKVIDNYEHWFCFYNLINELKSQHSIEIIYKEAMEHLFGYQQASILASIASYRFDLHPCDVYIKNTSAMTYWKPINERHPLLYAKYLILDTRNNSTDYYLINTKNEAEIGKYIGNAAYMLVRLNKPNHQIDELKTYIFNSNLCFDVLLSIQLDELFKTNNQRIVAMYGTESFHTKQAKLLSIKSASTNEKIAGEIYPSGLSLQSIQIFNFLENLLSRYNENDASYTYINITDHFYHNNKLKPEFIVGYKQHNIIIAYNNFKINIPLVFELDLPDRNQLKQLEQYKPNIELIVWSVSDNAVKYACIVKTKDAIGVWINYHANNVIICY